MKMIGAFFV
ncbi:hypothetical protein SAMN03080615_04129 [Amphritea atlantica]|uniref:Uncharacterized protein n=1 Tax=Amphritea atlantica TaxID=355243 RepID=A0A1H9JUV6_9GAMM|nr:hypothetical protein SAMN03080615_02218 [Amphritea atlantica]SEQ90544.1 hypothetical protein SAMN03080615_03201 [Amphritea atlantica]SER15392.1 hypothetical protein SAMN03080615_04129 [Amphritea atlantica]